MLVYLVAYATLTSVFWWRLKDAEGKPLAILFVGILIAVVLGSMVFMFPEGYQSENNWIRATLETAIPEELLKWVCALVVIQAMGIQTNSAKVSIYVYAALSFGMLESLAYVFFNVSDAYLRLSPTVMHVVCGMVVAEGAVTGTSLVNRYPAIGLVLAFSIHAAHNLLVFGEWAQLVLLWTNVIFAWFAAMSLAPRAVRLLFSRVEVGSVRHVDWNDSLILFEDDRIEKSQKPRKKSFRVAGLILICTLVGVGLGFLISEGQRETKSEGQKSKAENEVEFAQWPGGLRKAELMMGQELSFKAGHLDIQIHDLLIVDLTISKYGAVSKTEVVRSVHPELDAHAAKWAREEMSMRWVPAEQNHQRIESKVRLHVAVKTWGM
jgi:hypothetical protein